AICPARRAGCRYTDLFEFSNGAPRHTILRDAQLPEDHLGTTGFNCAPRQIRLRDAQMPERIPAISE
ncbi:hypothetical protein A2U01_0090375, partial [Trifolium medium]|nr:hypothetical protein [Trifolium medium]